MNTLQAVARILKTEGVEWISCFPSNNLIEAVAQEGIRPIMFRQERGAIMAADGYSRMNNRKKFGVIVTQGGPGSENCMGGLAQAFADNVPILYLPGGPAISQHSVRPNFSPAHAYEPVSVYSEVLWKADMTASVMRRAFHRLRNGRPGPVTVEIPADVSTQEVPDSVVIAYIGRSNGAGPTLSAMSTIPVITVPASIKEFPDDLWSSLRAPSNVPVMTVLEPSNAVLAALQILSARNPRHWPVVAKSAGVLFIRSGKPQDAEATFRQALVTLEKLIQLKRAAGRPKDLEAVAELLALLEERRKAEPPA